MPYSDEESEEVVGATIHEPESALERAFAHIPMILLGGGALIGVSQVAPWWGTGLVAVACAGVAVARARLLTRAAQRRTPRLRVLP